MLQENERSLIEKRLLDERKRALDSLGHFDELSDELRERTGELSGMDQHMADYATEQHEQEQQFLMASVEGRRLYALDEALQRLYKEPEQFGTCDVCGKQIDMARLDVIPETRLCAEHARARDEASDADADPREADGTAHPA
jgi:RNA polymerase-binding transcription factor DksA